MDETGSDQFLLLEKKIESLIQLVIALKGEKESFTEKYQIQEEKLANLREQIEDFKADRDRAKQRIVSLLEKIEQLEI